MRVILLREWVLPFGTGFNLNGLDASQDGNDLWFVETGALRIARLHVRSNTLTEWQLPIAVNQLNHNYVQERFVYFSDYSGNTILRLDPVTNIIKVWTDPNPAPAGIVDVSVTQIAEGPNESTEPVRVYLGESAGNHVGKFITTLAPSSDYFVSPTNTVLTPVDSATTVTTSTPLSTVTHVTPVTTVVHGVTNGAYTFWTIPTANSGFGNFAKFGEGSLFFTERAGNKITLLANPHNASD